MIIYTMTIGPILVVFSGNSLGHNGLKVLYQEYVSITAFKFIIKFSITTNRYIVISIDVNFLLSIRNMLLLYR